VITAATSAGRAGEADVPGAAIAVLEMSGELATRTSRKSTRNKLELVDMKAAMAVQEAPELRPLKIA
jgi:hypothetical protein